MKCLKAPCVKTSRQSFETDSANQYFFIQIFCACTSYGISSLSPKATEKKEPNFAKQFVHKKFGRQQSLWNQHMKNYQCSRTAVNMSIKQCSFMLKTQIKIILLKNKGSAIYLFYLRDCTMLPSPRRRPANITNQSRCYLPPPSLEL